MDDVPLNTHGAPSHFIRSERRWLDENYPGRWARRGGPIVWSPRPGLKPLNLFVWGFMKEKVCFTEIADRDQRSGATAN